MKQRITVEDLSELTELQKTKLRKWYFNQIEWDDDIVCVYLPDEGITHYGKWDEQMQFDKAGYIGKVKNYDREINPLLDIGQMIQLLNKKTLQTYIFTKTNRERKSIVYHDSIGYEHFNTVAGESIELCDALWMAIKQVL